MKTIYFPNLVAMLLFSTSTAMAVQPFSKGDRKTDLSIGVGFVDYPSMTKATFDQQLGMEWGVATIADKFTLGVGFTINNTYGGCLDGQFLGTYDYTYKMVTQGRVYQYSSKKWVNTSDTKDVRRKGYGSADGTQSREDINAMFNAALHFSPMPRLDTYLKVGIGVGCMNWMFGNFHNEQGFDKKDYNHHTQSSVADYTTSYSYDDIKHVEWPSSKPKACVAVATYLGASYYLTDNWGLDLKIGLTNSNLKTGKNGYISSYGIFAVGASYKF